jgi:hypothetical protein
MLATDATGAALAVASQDRDRVRVAPRAKFSQNVSIRIAHRLRTSPFESILRTSTKIVPAKEVLPNA